MHLYDLNIQDDIFQFTLKLSKRSATVIRTLLNAWLFRRTAASQSLDTKTAQFVFGIWILTNLKHGPVRNACVVSFAPVSSLRTPDEAEEDDSGEDGWKDN